MKERDARIDRLFKSYYKSKQPKGGELFDRCEMLRHDDVYDTQPNEICNSLYQMKEPCPDLATLSAYVEGALNKEEVQHIAIHIKHCKTCMEQVDSASATIRDMQENRLEKTPEDLSSDTSSRISDSTRKTPPKE